MFAVVGIMGAVVGGAAASAATPASPGAWVGPAGSVVAVRAADGHLFAAMPTPFPRFLDLGGRLIATPSVAVSAQTQRTYYVGVGTGRQLWIRTDRESWRPLLATAQPGSCSHAPSVAIHRSTFAVACTSASDRHVYAASVLLPSDGSPPRMPSLHDQGGTSVSGPTVFFAQGRAALDMVGTATPFGNVYARRFADPVGRYHQPSGIFCAAQVGVTPNGQYVGCQNGSPATYGGTGRSLFFKYRLAGTVTDGVTGGMSGAMGIGSNADQTYASYFVTDPNGVVWSRSIDADYPARWVRFGGRAEPGVAVASLA